MNGDISSAVLLKLDNVRVIVNGKCEGNGSLCLNSDTVVWKSDDHSYLIEQNYRSILLHAISRNEPTHIYTQIQMGDELQEAYEAFSRAALLNPDVIPPDGDDGQAPLFFDISQVQTDLKNGESHYDPGHDHDGTNES